MLWARLKDDRDMKFRILTILLLINTLTSCGQKKMENKFYTWDNFVDNFGKEMVSAEDVHKNMVKSGLKDNCFTKMDFTFISNKKENLVVIFYCTFIITIFVF